MPQHNNNVERQAEITFWAVNFTGEGTASGGVRPGILDSFKVFTFNGGNLDRTSEISQLQDIRAKKTQEEVRILQRRFSVIFLFSTISAVVCKQC
jgi:hypothetical protein